LASRSGSSSMRSSAGDEEDAIVGSDAWLASWYYFGCMHG
jgi:hypothetical protein